MQRSSDAKPNVVDTVLLLILPRAYPQVRTIYSGTVFQQWSCNSHSVLFMYVVLYYYIVLQ